MSWSFILALTSLGASQQLPAIAQTGARPQACRGATSVWQQARHPELEARCWQLARAHSLFRESPEAARALAEGMMHAGPLAREASLLAARLAATRRSFAEAWELFASSGYDTPEAFVSATALHDFATTAAAVGQLSLAESAYNKLVPRITLLAAEHERPRVAVFEAAMLMLGKGGSGNQVAASLLREIARPSASSTTLDLMILGARELASAGAEQGLVAVHQDAGVWAERLEVTLLPGDRTRKYRKAGIPSVDAVQSWALVAALSSQQRPDLAERAWKAVFELAPEQSTWRERARQALSLTSSGPP